MGVGVPISHEDYLNAAAGTGDVVLADLYSDTNGIGRLHEMGIETYVATRAVKTSFSLRTL